MADSGARIQPIRSEGVISLLSGPIVKICASGSFRPDDAHARSSLNSELRNPVTALQGLDAVGLHKNAAENGSFAIAMSER